MPNPVVLVQSPTTLSLKWSPPFLWPGYHIDYFNVSTIPMNKINRITHYDVINTSFDDTILTLSKTITNSDRQRHKCNQLLFEIRSYNNYLGLLPRAFSITGNFPSGKVVDDSCKN